MEFPLNRTPVATAASWSVLAILLLRGRPARLSDLDVPPDFIRFICSIPNSSLRLTGDGFITLSEIGIAALSHFFDNSDLIARYSSLPQNAPRLLTNVRSNSSLRTYCRKRKRAAVELEDFPTLKRKTFFQDLNHEENSDQMPMAILFKSQNVFTQLMQALSNLPSLSTFDCWKLKRDVFIPVPKMQMLGCLHRMNSLSYSRNRVMTPYTHGIMAEVLLNSVPSQLSHPVTGNNSEEGAGIGDVGLVNPAGSIPISASSKIEICNQMIIRQGKDGAVIDGCDSLLEGVNWKMKKALMQNSGCGENHKENQLMDGTLKNMSHIDNPEKALPKSNIKGQFFVRPRTEGHQKSKRDILNHRKKNSSSFNPDNMDEAHDMEKDISPTVENRNHISDQGREQFKRDKNSISVKQKKQIECDQTVSTKEKRDTSIENREKASSASNNVDQEPFPEFESFIVEEQEGSGGYGTVYRARRKADGLVFAIKCPHVNANKTNVNNEMKMLERFGGKDFVIKYEGSFKSRNSDCLVLQHVQHDRPENLKKEMNVDDFQWYGYCLFKALAGLHKQGIVHRDVKPGNFLYSCKFNRGYLIDFNLAFDTRKKYGTVDNCKVPSSICRTKSGEPGKSRNLMDTACVDSVNKIAGKVCRSVLPPGNLKRKLDKAKVGNVIKSQGGGDGSGITSAKGSAERLREPLPSHGRRELLDLVQEARQGESVCAPKSKRKRVAAPAAGDTKLLYITPMPLHANGLAIRGAGSVKTKGDWKPTREGPCAGTKGFKAPEVLLKSLHQGPKVDIWSAGVTLLYMMIGKTPFFGDTEQNIKEIAKLRGIEQLWEVAKLHNTDSLFPTDLLDVKYLAPTNLRDWCARNTRRPDLLDAIPRSLFDLVDKCLAVNPRERISADEALAHEFFAPCLKSLRKRRLLLQHSKTRISDH